MGVLGLLMLSLLIPWHQDLKPLYSGFMNKAIQKHIEDFFYKILWFNSDDVSTVCQNVVSDLYIQEEGLSIFFPSDVICLEILSYNTLSVYSCFLPCLHDGADFRLKLCTCHLKYIQIYERQDII